ncbi:MAG: hypothetical protein IT381_02865 [Deltaproteobacteria bacterium]|nr:hypothetical protein [Deltaproteobacteria bacterium]
MLAQISTAVLDLAARGFANEHLRQSLRIAHGLSRGAQRHLPRRLPYDDTRAEFLGGEMKGLLDTNYEKSLRNLWKAELEAPTLGFRDAARGEQSRRAIRAHESALDAVEGEIGSADFARAMSQHYSRPQRQALAEMLSVILHGEAYALYVSATLLTQLPGTGAKIGLSMQVLEEAKHFVVMRELVRKIDRVYPQKLFDRWALEGVLGAHGTQRLFGMNVMIEGVATTFFQTFQKFKGLENILHLFQLDESRHAAFAQLYLDERPLDRWQRFSPTQQFERLSLILPLLGLIFEMEAPARVLGVDIHEFGVRCLDHVVRLAERAQFHLPLDRVDVLRLYNLVFNAYRRVAEPARYQLTNYALFVDPERKLALDSTAPEQRPLPQHRLGDALKASVYRRGYALLDRREAVK